MAGTDTVAGLLRVIDPPGPSASRGSEARRAAATSFAEALRGTDGGIESRDAAGASLRRVLDAVGPLSRAVVAENDEVALAAELDALSASLKALGGLGGGDDAEATAVAEAHHRAHASLMGPDASPGTFSGGVDATTSPVRHAAPAVRLAALRAVEAGTRADPSSWPVSAVWDGVASSTADGSWRVRVAALDAARAAFETSCQVAKDASTASLAPPPPSAAVVRGAVARACALCDDDRWQVRSAATRLGAALLSATALLPGTGAGEAGVGGSSGAVERDIRLRAHLVARSMDAREDVREAVPSSELFAASPAPMVSSRDESDRSSDPSQASWDAGAAFVEGLLPGLHAGPADTSRRDGTSCGYHTACQALCMALRRPVLVPIGAAEDLIGADVRPFVPWVLEALGARAVTAADAVQSAEESLAGLTRAAAGDSVCEEREGEASTVSACPISTDTELLAAIGRSAHSVDVAKWTSWVVQTRGTAVAASDDADVVAPFAAATHGAGAAGAAAVPVSTGSIVSRASDFAPASNAAAMRFHMVAMLVAIAVNTPADTTLSPGPGSLTTSFTALAAALEHLKPDDEVLKRVPDPDTSLVTRVLMAHPDALRTRSATLDARAAMVAALGAAEAATAAGSGDGDVSGVMATMAADLSWLRRADVALLAPLHSRVGRDVASDVAWEALAAAASFRGVVAAQHLVSQLPGASSRAAAAGTQLQVVKRAASFAGPVVWSSPAVWSAALAAIHAVGSTSPGRGTDAGDVVADVVAAHADELVAWARAAMRGEPVTAATGAAVVWVLGQLRFPHLRGDILGNVLPVAFKLYDDHEAHSQWLGVSLLAHVLEHSVPTELSVHGAIIEDVLKRGHFKQHACNKWLATHARLLLLPMQHGAPPAEAYDDAAAEFCKAAASSITRAEQELFAAALAVLFADMGVCAARHLRTAIPLLKSNASDSASPATSLASLRALTVLATECWPRMRGKHADALLGAAVRTYLQADVLASSGLHGGARDGAARSEAPQVADALRAAAVDVVAAVDRATRDEAVASSGDMDVGGGTAGHAAGGDAAGSSLPWAAARLQALAAREPRLTALADTVADVAAP